jgi:hypothetical protein
MRQRRAAPAPQSRLGTLKAFLYRAAVTGLLRLVGLCNAAIWFGAGIFLTCSVDPAANSQEMKALLGAKNFPYFSVAIGQMFASRYFHLFLFCSVVSLLHLLAEWLYLGRNPQRFWTLLLIGLVCGGLVQACWVQPKLKQIHLVEFTRPQLREETARNFKFWQGVSEVINVLLLAGLGSYLWRVAHPPDTTRFVGTPKLRS